MTDTSASLKACPICGRAGKLTVRGNAAGIQCRGKTHLLWAYGTTPFEATENWNTRTPPESSEPSAGEWRTIDSAPRGPRIMVYEPDGLGQCVASAGWSNSSPDNVEWQVVNEITVHPTHWMPLPTPPVQS